MLAIDPEAGRYAFSFDGESDALNMCGTTGCEVVATFSACLGLGYSSPTQGRDVWTWVEAVTEGAARQGALDECERAGGPACEGPERLLRGGAGGRGCPATADRVPGEPVLAVDRGEHGPGGLRGVSAPVPGGGRSGRLPRTGWRG